MTQGHRPLSAASLAWPAMLAEVALAPSFLSAPPSGPGREAYARLAYRASRQSQVPLRAHIISSRAARGLLNGD